MIYALLSHQTHLIICYFSLTWPVGSQRCVRFPTKFTQEFTMRERCVTGQTQQVSNCCGDGTALPLIWRGDRSGTLEVGWAGPHGYHSPTHMPTADRSHGLLLSSLTPFFRYRCLALVWHQEAELTWHKLKKERLSVWTISLSCFVVVPNQPGTRLGWAMSIHPVTGHRGHSDGSSGRRPWWHLGPGGLQPQWWARVRDSSQMWMRDLFFFIVRIPANCIPKGKIQMVAYLFESWKMSHN